MSLDQLKLFSGTANPNLARDIADFLDVPLGPIQLTNFSDGEMFVEIGENVRGADVFFVQSTSSPANERLMELLITADALRRASANSICAVIPYFGYARQDRKVQPRTPITSKLVANLLATAGVTRVLSVDLHAGQIQGFFDIPFDHMFSMPILLKDMKKRFDPEKVVLVSPDAGGVERARAYAKRLGAQIAIIDKRRPKPNVAEVMHIVGDVQDMTAIIIDDLVDTAGTLTQAAAGLLEHGAERVFAYASHAVLSGPAIERIEKSPIERCVFTDTITLSPQAEQSDKIETKTIAPLLAKAIRRICMGESVSSLFV